MTEDAPQSETSVDAQQNETNDSMGSLDSQYEESYGRNVLLHYEQRIQRLEAEVQTLKETLQITSEHQENEQLEFTKRMADVDRLRARIKEIARSSSESNKIVQSMEKRIDGVKRFATSGVVVSILAFSIMLLLSLFIRSQ